MKPQTQKMKSPNKSTKAQKTTITIKNKLPATKKPATKIKPSKQSLAAHKAWITIRNRYTKTEIKAFCKLAATRGWKTRKKNQKILANAKKTA